jgi:hypothetical protein
MPTWVMSIISLVISALCLYPVMTSGGWFSIIGDVFWPVVGVVHFLAHSIALLRSRSSVQGSLLRLMVVSHVLFIVGFLLQYDEGDSSVWLIITQLFHHRQAPAWWPDNPITNLCLFFPVLVTWIKLLQHRPVQK